MEHRHRRRWQELSSTLSSACVCRGRATCPGRWTTQGYGNGDADPCPRVTNCLEHVRIGIVGGRTVSFPAGCSTLIGDLHKAAEEELETPGLKLLHGQRTLDPSKTLADENLPSSTMLTAVTVPASVMALSHIDCVGSMQKLRLSRQSKHNASDKNWAGRGIVHYLTLQSCALLCGRELVNKGKRGFGQP